MELAAPPALPPSPATPHASALTRRILSALVMMPVALAAVWFGSPFLPALVALAGAGMGWEWARLSRMSSPVAVTLIVAAPFLAACAVAVGHDRAALVLAVVFALGAALAENGLASRAWSLVAGLWIALPCIAMLWLDRGAAQNGVARGVGGRATIFFLLAVVWASDIGAYAAGRSIGGPKLAPALSPNKTWAGSIGGLLASMLVGLVAARLAQRPMAPIVAASFAVAVAAQIGDLAESFAKRYFHVKDSGALIPGHGGLLDRLDSLLAAAMALAAILAANGTGLFSNGP